MDRSSPEGRDGPTGRLSGTIEIRPATPDDSAEIAAISVAGWQAAYQDILPAEFLAGLSVESRSRGWRMWLEDGERSELRAWLATLGTRAIGFASSGPARDEDLLPGTAEVYAIYIVPNAWRMGAGRALIERATDHWRRRGSARLVLWVFEENRRGRAFYESLGWRPDGGRQELAIGGRSAFEVRYGLDLDGAPANAGPGLDVRRRVP